MSTLDKKFIRKNISPPLDSILTEQLINEYVSLGKRYLLGDWEPATLDGGQFVEAASRILYHIDSSNLNRRKGVNNCLDYIENANAQHNYPDRRSTIHTAKALRAMYKFRSDRGAIHIDPTYDANHLDSKFIMDNAKWVIAEILRIFWKGRKTDISKLIRDIIQYDIPCIRVVEGRILVQRTDCTVEEEILIILYFIGEDGAGREFLKRSIPKHPTSINLALRQLSSPKKRMIIQKNSGNFILTDIGIKYVMFTLSDKIKLK